MRRRALGLLVAAVVVFLPTGGTAAAHTDSDLVAVPAGAAVVVTLAPTHGCGGSPTVRVSTRVPVPDAFGGDVEGWRVSDAADGVDRTVVSWSGGRLSADQEGAFPVHFTVPDRVGELVILPFVQDCADGSELAWISGDPAAEFPAPRVLVLAAGSAPARSIADVPADAPGRNLLTEIVDVDGGGSPTATTVVEPPGSTPAERTPGDGDGVESADDGGSALVPAIGVGSALLAVGVGAGWAVRRRRATSAPDR